MADLGSDLDMIYPELKRIAQAHLRHHQRDAVLHTTVLVHDAFIKIAEKPDLSELTPSHLKRLLSRSMRQVLIDQARKRSAAKRGGGLMPLTLPMSLISPDSQKAIDLLIIEDVIAQMRAADPRLEDVVECRFYGGLTTEETADALELSPRSVERYWARAKAYLITALEL